MKTLFSSCLLGLERNIEIPFANSYLYDHINLPLGLQLKNDHNDSEDLLQLLPYSCDLYDCLLLLAETSFGLLYRHFYDHNYEQCINIYHHSTTSTRSIQPKNNLRVECYFF